MRAESTVRSLVAMSFRILTRGRGLAHVGLSDGGTLRTFEGMKFPAWSRAVHAQDRDWLLTADLRWVARAT